MSYCPEDGTRMEECCKVGGSICYICPQCQAQDSPGHWACIDRCYTLQEDGVHSCPVCQEAIADRRGKRRAVSRLPR